MTRPNFNPDSKFTPEAHEAYLAERYARLARYDAFDALVDLALDGQIDLGEAKVAWESGAWEHDPELPASLIVDEPDELA